MVLLRYKGSLHLKSDYSDKPPSSWTSHSRGEKSSSTGVGKDRGDEIPSLSLLVKQVYRDSPPV